MNIHNETWETVPDFPNYMISSESRIMNKTTLKMVSISLNKRFRHRAVRLWNSGKTRLLKVYRLKAAAFIPNPENKPQVNHIDGDRMNEDLSNLEWATASENMKHSFASGLCKGFYKKGFDHQKAKLSLEDINLMRRWKNSGFYDPKKICKVFSISRTYAQRVASGKEGNHV